MARNQGCPVRQNSYARTATSWLPIDSNSKLAQRSNPYCFPHRLTPRPRPAQIHYLKDDSIFLSVEVAVGSQVAFQLNYSALVRAMTSPFVANFVRDQDANWWRCHEATLPIVS